MAKQIIWSLRAQKDRTKILKYWLNRNKSNDYSTKINELFKEAAKLIAIYPKLGRPTDQPNVRLKVVRDYILFYEEINNQIFILTIWDSRQSPEKLEKLMKNKRCFQEFFITHFKKNDYYKGIDSGLDELIRLWK